MSVTELNGCTEALLGNGATCLFWRMTWYECDLQGLPLGELMYDMTYVVVACARLFVVGKKKVH